MNRMIIYKKSIFSKIKNLIFNFFNKKTLKQNNSLQPNDSTPSNSSFQQLSTTEQTDSNHFLDSIIIKDKEKFRILALKDKYDKKEIALKNISLSDLSLLIQAYNEETTKLNLDTQRILKNSQNNS